MSGRPWIEHDGSGCPVPVGTMVEVMRRNGAIYGPYPAMTEAVHSDGRAIKATFGRFSAWDWDAPLPELHITHYRLSDTDDKAKREARMAEFTRIAEEGLKTDRPVKTPQKVGGGPMTRVPFGYTLLGASTVCFAFWSVTLNQVQYVGTLAFMGLQLCAACWMIVGVVKLINKVRQAFTFASYDLADFVAGKKAPLVKSQPRTPTGQFASKREVIHAALRRDLEAK